MVSPVDASRKTVQILEKLFVTGTVVLRADHTKYLDPNGSSGKV